MERSYSRYLLVVLCLSIVCTAIILIALNTYTVSKRGNVGLVSTSSDTQIVDAYKEGFEAARSRFAQYGLGVIGETNILIGRVQSTSGGKLIVSQENLMTDALVSGISDDREVAITGSSKITRSTAKSTTQLAAEQEAFAKLPPSPSLQPPLPTIQSTIRVSDIKVGDRVIVTAQENDITALGSVTAVSISVQP